MNSGHLLCHLTKTTASIKVSILSICLLLLSWNVNSQPCNIQCQNCIQSTNGILNNGTTGFCPGRTVKLYFNGNCVNNTSQYSFQWQVSTGPGTWANIPGATTDTLTVSAANTYQLIISGPGPCTSSCSITVNAYNSPVAEFSAAPNNTCGRTNVHFTNNSTLPGGGTMTYQWNFGDPGSGANNTTTITNPSHYYIPPIGTGTQVYTVTLIATSSNGCKDTVTHTVTIGERPDATLDEITTGGVVTINGQLYFRKCSPTPWTMEFLNASTTNSFNTSYTIIWGDATPNFNSPAFPASVTHTYGVGSYILQYIVRSATCADTTRYNIFVGNQPAGGLLSPGSTTICNGSAQAFIISGATGNPPGTQYTLTFNDGSNPVTFIHPSPDTVFHTFDSTSCGTTSTSGNTTYPNAFGAFLTITNPCGTTSGSIVPIYVSGKPVANFSITPKDTVCQTQTVTFTNTGNSGNTAENGVCTPGKVVWKVTSNIPGTPWTLIGGNMGSDVGSWTTGTQNINIRFDSVGIYTIKLKMRNSTLCGMDSITKTICVNPLPTADFYLTKTTLCVDDSVTAFGITNIPHCGLNTYKWTIGYQAVNGCTPAVSDYTFLGGTTDTSANPKIRYNNPGIYAVSLQTFAPGLTCFSPVITRYDTVKGKPVVTLSTPLTACQSATIAPTATATCFTTNATYQWSFPGGSPASSTSLNPGNITYATAGTYTITLSVTNDCGTTTRTSSITINPLPLADAGPDRTICSGGTTTIGTPAINGNTYLWAPAAGLSSATAANPTLTLTNPGATPVVFTYVVTVTNSNNCSATDTVLITVNPLPPVTVSPNIGICTGSSTTLTAAGADTYLWSPATGLSSTTGAVVTANPAVTTTYTVTGTITSTGCFRSASVTVTINPLPVVNAGADINVCNNQAPVTLTGTPAGGSWSGPNITAGGVFTSSGPGIFPVTYTYTNGNGCTNSDVAQVTVFEETTVSNAGPDQDLCGTVVSMAANLPVIGTGAWSQVSGPNTATITAPANPTTTMTGLIPGTYIFRWTISNGPCSSSDNVTVLILPGPTSANAGIDQALCLSANATLTANTPVIGSGVWSQVSGPAATINTPGNNVTTVSGLTPGTYVFRWTISYSNCPPSSDDVQVIIYDNPSTAAAGTDQEICGTNTQLAATPATTGTGVWNLVSGPNTPVIANPALPNSLLSNLVPGVYQLKWSISNGVCPVSEDIVQITVGALPTPSNAGSDQTLCSATTLTLQGNTPTTGTGTWTQVAGAPVTITNPALPTTTVTGLLPGSYTFQWTITNSVCPPSQDQVIITNYNTIINQINTTPQTLCAGQTLQINGQLPTGGNGIYNYQWQQSADGVTWTDIPGATGQNLTYTVNSSLFIRRVVTSLPCTSNSQSVFITVLAAITNNTLNGNQSVCINTAPAAIIGSVPSGGDGTFVYSWQQSTDGGATWTLIAGAAAKDYAPGVLTQSTCYRRLVSTNLCAGPQSNTSPAICITVNPDAQALFTYPADTACAPSAIQIQNTSPANRHLRYDWFADNNFIGSGQAFPGYTIPAPGQSVTIKLVAISAFGCKNDSLSHVFATKPIANPSFTASDTVGCGPLTVSFTNTTAQQIAFSYFWDFGNGVTSTLAQPGPVVFNPNPKFQGYHL
jgi:PKD repeat protein